MTPRIICRICFFGFLITLAACTSLLKRSINYTGKWNGSDLPGYNYATFKDFNGHQNFSIPPNSKGTLYIKYAVKVDKGTLILKISSPKKTIVSKTISGTIADSVLVADVSNGRLSILFDASHADGSFDLKYGSKKE